MTQEQLAETLNVSLMSIYRWEASGQIPGAFQRARLCALFSKSEQELGWPAFESREALITGKFAFIDPNIPLVRPALAGQQVLLRAIQAHFLAAPMQSRVLGIIGLPGSGKTAIAAALVGMPKLPYHFDGVLWATVGQTSTSQRHLLRWAMLLGIEELPADLDEAKEVIRTTIGTRRLLIVLDDVWNPHDILAYQCGSTQSHYLVTSRQPQLIRSVSDIVYRPVPLSPAHAIELLSRALPSYAHAHEYHSALCTIAQRLGNLPLALEIAAAYLRLESAHNSRRRIAEAISNLAHPDPAFYLTKQCTPEGISLSSVIQRSERTLSTSARQAFFNLAGHFTSAPASFSEAQAVNRLQMCGLQTADLDQVLDSGLLETAGESRYWLHPVITDYARLQAQGATVSSTASAVS